MRENHTFKLILSKCFAFLFENKSVANLHEILLKMSLTILDFSSFKTVPAWYAEVTQAHQFFYVRYNGPQTFSSKIL